MFVSLLATLTVAAATPDSVSPRPAIMPRVASSMAYTTASFANGANTGLIFAEPGIENLGKNLLLLFGGQVVGAGVGVLAAKIAYHDAPLRSEEFWTQDAAANGSLLLSGYGALSTSNVGVKEAAGWGWGLQLSGLVAQRQVLSHWGRDSARLALLTRAQYANLHVALLQICDQSVSGEGFREVGAGIAPLLLHPAAYALAFAADPATTPQQARARGDLILASGVILAPLAGLAAATATDGDLSSSMLAAAGAEASGLAVAIFVDDLPGSERGRAFILKGAALGGGLALGLGLERIQSPTSDLNKGNRSDDRRTMWLFTASGSVLGGLGGWLFSALPFPGSNTVDVVPPGLVANADGRLVLGMGGLVVHLPW